MLSNRLAHVLRRALHGVKRRPGLHLLSLLTLAAAFLSFAATLTAAANLDTLLGRWIGAAELTVYLDDHATTSDQQRLAMAIAELPGVVRVEQVSQQAAREEFARDMGNYAETARTLPVSAFPASLEVHLGALLARSQPARRALFEKLSSVEFVREVELYDSWFEKLSALSLVGRIAAWGLGLIAFIVAVLVVTAVVRAGVAARAREIEVLYLVGATERYVRIPFLLEGALEAALAMVIALIALAILMSSVGDMAAELLPLLGLQNAARLAAPTSALLVAGAAIAGLAGAKLSLRELREGRC